MGFFPAFLKRCIKYPANLEVHARILTSRAYRARICLCGQERERQPPAHRSLPTGTPHVPDVPSQLLLQLQESRGRSWSVPKIALGWARGEAAWWARHPYENDSHEIMALLAQATGKFLGNDAVHSESPPVLTEPHLLLEIDSDSRQLVQYTLSKSFQKLVFPLYNIFVFINPV